MSQGPVSGLEYLFCSYALRLFSTCSLIQGLGLPGFPYGIWCQQNLPADRSMFQAWCTIALFCEGNCWPFSSSLSGGQSCSAKNFGHGSLVCECGADYCDTLEPVSLPPPGSFVKYESNKAGRRMEHSFGRLQNDSAEKGGLRRSLALLTRKDSSVQSTSHLFSFYHLFTTAFCALQAIFIVR